MALRSVMKAVLLALVLAACGAEETSAQARCDLCGMRVDPSSGWRAGGRGSDGAELTFDAPKCMFRYHHQRGGVREPWVIEYYSQARRPAPELFYVLGSDVRSPMGRDLVPVHGRDEAERFARDHHGERVLAFDEVSAAIVEELFRPRAH